MKDREELWVWFNEGKRKEVIVELLMDIREQLTQK